jgi:hypothetical protein
MNDLSDTLASKGLLTESPLDIVQNFRMDRILVVQDVLELQIGRTEAVAEVLSEDPSTV